MNLKPLAKSAVILDGLATLWLLPFESLHTQLQIDKIRTEFVDIQEWEYWRNVFMFFESFVVGVDFEPSDNAHVRGLSQYWDGRNGSVAHNAELFPNLVSRDVLTIIMQAWYDTREKLPGVSDVLAAGKPDKMAYNEDEKKSTK